MLSTIITEIKKINDEREKKGQNFISQDESNEEIYNILRKHDLEDDADSLEEAFGQDGLHSIRDAEAGMY